MNLRAAFFAACLLCCARVSYAQTLPSPAELTEQHKVRYVLEGVEIQGNIRTADRVVLRYVKFRAGTILDVDDPELELIRYRLLGTGFFQKATLSLRKGSKPGQVFLVISVQERNTIVVNDVWLGLAATSDDKGRTHPLSGYGGFDVAETNLAGTGITLGGALGITKDQSALRVRFFDPAFLGTSWMVQGTLLRNLARDFYGNKNVLYDDPVSGAERVQNFAQVSYRRFGGTLGLGRDISVPTQVWADYQLEAIEADLPLAASHKRGTDIEPIEFHLAPGKSILSALRITLQHDTRDAPVLPTRGWTLTAAGHVSLAPLGSSYPYQKLQLKLAHWMPVWRRKGHVLRVDGFVGFINGKAPVFEKFYPADFSDFLPDRVLDLNVDSRHSPNLLDTAIAEVRHGDYAGKISTEYRIPIYRGSRSVYGIDLFASAGIFAIAAQRDLTTPLRGYSGLSRVPTDLTFNVGFRADTKVGGFMFAFANAFGFLPVLGGGGTPE